ncbi:MULTISPECIES: hypothetical protein [Streptomyces]|uniref:Transposase n=1 Tax=Streptomyces lonegramiae TaxID=3075524 RepID=A0ABU2XUD2_9ACTN|nr:hypothetical protein [Streptomyces sp. DSM 41529]MDT0549531.1 hypothetical protein [Streptomyces sp. DSM 41529]
MEGRAGRPKGYCHRQMLDAVFYVLETGSSGGRCRWTFP